MSTDYRTILKTGRAEFIEKKSRFISTVQQVETEEDAKAFIEAIREEFPGTTNAYAYYLRDNNTIRFFDDGEPSGTAGLSILDVLKHENLVNVVLVVTRYFGGILLGKGGLARAFTKGAKLAIEDGKIAVMTYSGEIRISVSYELYGKLQYLLEQDGIKTENTDFGQEITVTLFAPEAEIPVLEKKVTEATNGKAVFIVSEMGHRLMEA